MGTRQPPAVGAIELGRDFFREVVRPAMERVCPRHLEAAACGRTTPPERDTNWLDIPEEDIVHVVNGEVWHDPSGGFSRVRAVFEGYYPDAVWKRRIAHWCRYASGMGLYWMQRARLRDNLVFLHTSFASALKRTIELAFLLNRTYFPYDKWLYPLFRRLGHPAPDMVPLIDAATADGATWERRFEIMQTLPELLDRRMVELGPGAPASPLQAARHLRVPSAGVVLPRPAELDPARAVHARARVGPEVLRGVHHRLRRRPDRPGVAGHAAPRGSRRHALTRRITWPTSRWAL